MENTEIWKPIRGYEGKYEVSNLGRVRSLNYNHTGEVSLLKPGENKGYQKIQLWNNKEAKWFRIHRLVYEAFVAPIPVGMQIDHINGLKQDNRLDNLRCVTPKENQNNPITRQRHLEVICNKSPEWLENQRNAIRKFTKKPEWLEKITNKNRKIAKDPVWQENHRSGVRKVCNKPVLQLTKSGELVHEWECMTDAERATKIDQSSISRCCHGRQKTAGGYLWRFVND